MVSDIIKDRAAFYVSVISIFWQSAVSIALIGILQFYCAYIHVFAVQIMRSEFFGFGNHKDSETKQDGLCQSMNDEVRSDSENEKFLHNIQTWDLARIFDTLDSDRDGMVSPDDIQGLFEKLGIQFFCDDNMKIIMGFQEHMNFEDFCRLCVSLWEETQSVESMHQVYEKRDLREAFSVFDKNGDGFITPSELQVVLLSLGLRGGQDLENCETMIRRFDKNSDGRLDFLEFENMLTMIN